MKVAVFSTHEYDRRFLEEANEGRLSLEFFKVKLELATCPLADRFPVVCTFVNDDLGPDVLLRLFAGGTRMLALRCAGFNNVDFQTVHHLELVIARVPAYSPHSISEYTIGLIIALARKICKAYVRTREGNFSLEGLLGYNICDRTAGVMGTGKIGALVARGLLGLGCHRVIAYDRYINEELVAAGVEYVSAEELYRHADIITLHCPLTEETHHMINRQTIEMMPDNVMLVNTSRGALVDTRAVIDAMKSGKIGALALDVYEEESNFFFEDYSDRIINDDILARILNLPNVIVTGHQAFFTVEAMRSIARQTIENILAFEHGETPAGIIVGAT